MQESEENLDAGRPGERITRYSYTVSGERWLRVLDDALRARLGDQAQLLRNSVAELAAVDRPILEVAATAVYIRDEVGVTDERQLWGEVNRRKQHLAKHFDSAKQLMRNLVNRGLLSDPPTAQG